MKTTSTLGQTLQLLVLTLCGLSFYALMLMLLFLIGGLIISAGAHAAGSSAAAGSADSCAAAETNPSSPSSCVGTSTAQVTPLLRSTP
jgi:hypothetical protein